MMKKTLAFADRGIEIQYPFHYADTIDFLFSGIRRPDTNSIDHVFAVEQNGSGDWLLVKDGRDVGNTDTGPAMANLLMGEVIYAMIDGVHSGITLHGAAVAYGSKGIWLPGVSGAGKSSLTAWLVARGCTYLTDELIHCPFSGLGFEAFLRPLNFKNHGFDAIRPLLPRDCDRGSAGMLACDTVTMVAPGLLSPVREVENPELALLLFPRFSPVDSPEIIPLSPAQAGLRLMGCHVNARNLQGHGFPEVVELCRQVPACQVTFDSFARLEGVLDVFIDLVLEEKTSRARFTQCAELASRGLAGGRAVTVGGNDTTIPRSTPLLDRTKLTIGMATYDDYDGVYFTVQAIRLYHPEILDDAQIVIVDNNPEAPAAHSLKKLEGLGNLRYIPYREKTGTACRDRVFAEANSEYVLCLDSHVLIAPGALVRLLRFFEEHPGCDDLLQGVLVHDDLATVKTHFRKEWRQGMYGVWGSDPRGEQEDAEPFEIPMQGLGLFACRKDVWPGFHPEFRGFGGEEGYIHEKFRQQGGRTLCLPFLRWLHRFERPRGVRYPLNWEDRIWNYWVGFTELGLDTNEIVDHFNDHLGRETTKAILARLGLAASR